MYLEYFSFFMISNYIKINPSSNHSRRFVDSDVISFVAKEFHCFTVNENKTNFISFHSIKLPKENIRVIYAVCSMIRHSQSHLDGDQRKIDMVIDFCIFFYIRIRIQAWLSFRFTDRCVV